MRYYRFNRERSLDAVLQRRYNSSKKVGYMIRTNRSRILDSFYFENQTWGALHKAWKEYVIAKNKYEADRMYYYATVIQKLQKELGLNISSFPDLGLFGEEDVDDDSDCGTNQEMTEEELLQELMKQDREFLDKQRNQ